MKTLSNHTVLPHAYRHSSSGILYALLTASTLLISGCATKSFIVSGHSFATNDEAVREANNAIVNAQQGGCRAISIGGGTGTGVGVGLGIGVGLAVDECKECQVIEKKERDISVQGKQDYSVHVLLRCPSDIRDVQPNGVVVR